MLLLNCNVGGAAIAAMKNTTHWIGVEPNYEYAQWLPCYIPVILSEYFTNQEYFGDILYCMPSPITCLLYLPNFFHRLWTVQASEPRV